MQNLVHRLSDPRDPSYPFSDTYICSKCNERLQVDDTHCTVCNLGIHGMVKPIITKKRSKKANDQLNEQDEVNKKLKQSVSIDSNVDDLDTTAKNKNNEITVDPIEIPLDGTFKEILFLSLLLLLLLAIVIGYDINNTIVKALIDDPILTK